jgi:hypothetical protein
MPQLRRPALLLLSWIGLLGSIQPTVGQEPADLKITKPGAERRVALVIGNGAYQAAAKLANPVNDARAMAAKLKKVGFDVIEVEDGTQQSMRRAIGAFSNKLAADAVSLFYYAGHGMQVNGKNYLIPVDAEISTEQTVRLETIDVDAVIDQMAMAKSRINLVILDACRNNPYERRFRSQSGGLASIEAPTGTMIAYATSPGRVAADGDTGNGLYTSELVQAIDMPSAKVEDVFKRVRANVVTRSKGEQTPWESSSLTGDFYFSSQPTTTPGTPPASTTPVDRELAFWYSVKDTRNPALIQTYLDQFPQGTFAGLAKAMIDDLKKSQVAAMPTKPDVAPAASEALTIEEVEGAYITIKRANVRERPVADGKLVKALDAGVPVMVTGKVKDTGWYRVTSTDGKLRGFVFGDAIQDIKTAEEAEWQRVRDAKQSAILTSFLRRFPSGAFAQQAKVQRDALLKEEKIEPVSAGQQPTAAATASSPPQQVAALPRTADIFAASVAQGPSAMKIGTREILRFTDAANNQHQHTGTVTSVTGDSVTVDIDFGDGRRARGTRSIVPFAFPTTLETTAADGKTTKTTSRSNVDLRQMYPLSPGKSLSFDTIINGQNYNTRCFVEAATTVTVPMGTYQTIPVVCSYIRTTDRLEMRIFIAQEVTKAVKVQTHFEGPKGVQNTMTELVQLNVP